MYKVGDTVMFKHKIDDIEKINEFDKYVIERYNLFGLEYIINYIGEYFCSMRIKNINYNYDISFSYTCFYIKKC